MNRILSISNYYKKKNVILFNNHHRRTVNIYDTGIPHFVSSAASLSTSPPTKLPWVPSAYRDRRKYHPDEESTIRAGRRRGGGGDTPTKASSILLNHNKQSTHQRPRGKTLHRNKEHAPSMMRNSDTRGGTRSMMRNSDSRGETAVIQPDRKDDEYYKHYVSHIFNSIDDNSSSNTVTNSTNKTDTNYWTREDDKNYNAPKFSSIFSAEENTKNGSLSNKSKKNTWTREDDNNYNTPKIRGGFDNKKSSNAKKTKNSWPRDDDLKIIREDEALDEETLQELIRDTIDAINFSEQNYIIAQKTCWAAIRSYRDTSCGLGDKRNDAIRTPKNDRIRIPFEYDTVVLGNHNTNETTEKYPKLSAAIHDIVNLSLQLSRQYRKVYHLTSKLNDDSQDFPHHSKNSLVKADHYCQLAESAFRQLSDLDQQRKILAISSNQWIQGKNPKSSIFGRATTFNECITSILDRMSLPSETKYHFNRNYNHQMDNKSRIMPIDKRTNAREGTKAWAILRCITTVMNAKILQLNDDDDNNNNMLEYNHLCKDYTERVRKIVDRMSSDQVLVVQTQLMDRLCALGTINCARLSYHLYLRCASMPDAASFSTVIRSYTDATRNLNTDNDWIVDNIQKEAFATLFRGLDNIGTDQCDEKMLASNFLEFISVEMMTASKNRSLYMHRANRIFQRFSDEATYDQFKSFLVLPLESAMAVTLPPTKAIGQEMSLLNSFSHVLATHGSIQNVNRSKMALLFMMRNFRPGECLDYPKLDTIHTILHAIVGQREKDVPTYGKNPDALHDLDYAINKVFVYMLRDPEAACWPDDNTFTLLFNLIRATGGYDYADKLLGRIEVARYTAMPNNGKNSSATMNENNRQQKQQGFTIPLSTYHNVLECYLLSVKRLNATTTATTFTVTNRDVRNNEVRVCCERAVKLLDQLEVQSTPFLLDETSAAGFMTAERIYDLKLHPTQKTYELILSLCSEATAVAATSGKEEQIERIVQMAVDVYKRMEIQFGDMPASQDAVQLLLQSLNHLPADSQLRKDMSHLTTPEEAENDAEGQLRSEVADNGDIRIPEITDNVDKRKITA